MIPISMVDVRDAVPLVTEVLRSGIIAQGPKVGLLETMFAEIAGADHAVAVNSGTTALIASLQALGVGPGDEVVTSPFTFAATLNAIIESGATARFADISADDFCVTPDAVAAAVGPNTAVLMPVHLYGQMADMRAIASLAEKSGLAVVEDAAQAIGATFDGRAAGSYGLGCFSMYATKNVTTAEGGVITTGDAGLADRLRVLRNQGMRERYKYEVPGHNYRLTDLHAAVGIPQLEKLTTLTGRRRENAHALTAGLTGVPGLVLPTVTPGRTHVWHQYTVRVTEDAVVTRDELATALTERGVGSGIYYPGLVYDHDCYRNHPQVIPGDVPVAASVATQVLSLPVHPGVSPADVDTIVTAVREVLDR